MNRPAITACSMTRTRAKVRPAATKFARRTPLKATARSRGAFGVFVRKYAIFGDPAIRERMRKTLQARGLDTPIETLMSIFQRIVL
ncbi:MAG TPA: hypothetical protein VGZ27_15475 [Vicinamibacterales bacterium]|jgi:hypothetical protein|nr:hypothetical protein [Vicinamibacterales bacterium]